VKPQYIDSLGIAEPMSYIYYIQTGNNAVFNDSLTERHKILLVNGYNELLTTVQRKKTISVSDTGLRSRIFNEMVKVINIVQKYGNLYYVPPSPTIDSILNSNETRFGLFTFSSGFTREKGNFEKQSWKGLGIYAATLGIYHPIPISSNSTIYTVIFDAKEKNVAFYRKSDSVDDPLNEVAINRILTAIFKGYFKENK
jgi:hypothetical protein